MLVIHILFNIFFCFLQLVYLCWLFSGFFAIGVFILNDFFLRVTLFYKRLSPNETLVLRFLLKSFVLQIVFICLMIYDATLASEVLEGISREVPSASTNVISSGSSSQASLAVEETVLPSSTSASKVQMESKYIINDPFLNDHASFIDAPEPARLMANPIAEAAAVPSWLTLILRGIHWIMIYMNALDIRNPFDLMDTVQPVPGPGPDFIMPAGLESDGLPPAKEDVLIDDLLEPTYVREVQAYLITYQQEEELIKLWNIKCEVWSDADRDALLNDFMFKKKIYLLSDATWNINMRRINAFLEPNFMPINKMYMITDEQADYLQSYWNEIYFYKSETDQLQGFNHFLRSSHTIVANVSEIDEIMDGIVASAERGHDCEPRITHQQYELLQNYWDHKYFYQVMGDNAIGFHDYLHKKNISTVQFIRDKA